MTIANFTAQNAACWAVHPTYSTDVAIQRMTVLGPREIGGVDGIDPDSCENVLIEDYDYCGGDDAIAIKSGWNIAGVLYGRPTQHVTVRNSRSGCRGGWTIGSEAHAGVNNVTFENLVSTSESGIRISASGCLCV